MTAITVYKCDETGAVVWQYEGIMLEHTENMICLQATFNAETTQLGIMTIQRGDLFTEWFYTDRWYNIFRIEDGATGTVKGWYCNITRPATFTADSVRADDLALDVLVLPDGGIVLLDEDEFHALDVPASDREAALQAVQTLYSLVQQRQFPFDRIPA